MGEPDRPAAAEEGVLLGARQFRREFFGHRALGVGDRTAQVFAERRAEERERGRRESGLHDRLLVGERQQHGFVDEADERRGCVADDADGAHATAQALDELEHLGGRARPGEGDDGVVAAIDEGLGCRERVGLAVAAGFAEPCVRLRDEPGGAAADHGDACTASGEQRLLGAERLGPRPRLGLRVELGRHVFGSGVFGGRMLGQDGSRRVFGGRRRSSAPT